MVCSCGNPMTRSWPKTRRARGLNAGRRPPWFSDWRLFLRHVELGVGFFTRLHIGQRAAGKKRPDHVPARDREQYVRRMGFLVVYGHSPRALPPQASARDLLQSVVRFLVVGTFDPDADSLPGEKQAGSGNHAEAQFVDFPGFHRLALRMRRYRFPVLRVGAQGALGASPPSFSYF